MRKKFYLHFWQAKFYMNYGGLNKMCFFSKFKRSIKGCWHLVKRKATPETFAKYSSGKKSH